MSASTLTAPVAARQHRSSFGAGGQGRADPPEKRFAQRRARRLPATLYYMGAPQPFACYVTDVSSTGLAIEMRDRTGSVALPERVSIAVSTEAVQFDCVVAWRSNTRVGLKMAGAVRRLKKEPKRMIGRAAPAKKSLLSRLFGRS